MSLFMEIETDRKLPFDARKIAELVIETSLDYVKCPYETEVSLLLTTDEEIKEINRMQRQDRPGNGCFVISYGRL